LNNKIIFKTLIATQPVDAESMTIKNSGFLLPQE